MSTWDILQLFLILAVMTGIMYGLLYIVKKYLFSFENKGVGDSKIKVLSTQTILPKKYVSVIQYNENVYLLGVSDQSINLIDKLDYTALENNNKTESKTEKPNFLQLLKSNMGLK